MRNTEIPISLIALLMAMSVSTYAQDQKAAIQQKLESEYALTQATADNTDIVTAGAVLVLSTKRGGSNSNVVMVPVSSTNFYQNIYIDGKITQNATVAKAKKAKGFFDRATKVGSIIPGVGGAATAAGGASSTAGDAASAAGNAEPRTFVPGEKMWVTKIDVRDDSVVFSLFSDAYNNVRYKANLAFQFAKGSALSPDLVDKTVAEVFKVQPAEDKKADGQQQQAPAGGQQQQQAPVNAPPPAPAAPEPAAVIPPPPPPPADAPQAPPTTTSLGQTVDKVVADMGQPVKIVKLGTKQIYYYKDLKVIFVNGKVTDVQ